MNLKKTTLRNLALLSVLGLLACGGSDPASISKQIAELQAKNFPMTATQKARFAELSQKVQELMQAGKSEESIKALNEALAILKKAEDTAMFNKSE